MYVAIHSKHALIQSVHTSIQSVHRVIHNKHLRIQSVHRAIHSKHLLIESVHKPVQNVHCAFTVEHFGYSRTSHCALSRKGRDKLCFRSRSIERSD